MKRKLQLLTLSLLSLTLVGCDKNNDSGSSPTKPVKEETVIDRWWEKLQGDIKLSGKMIETVTEGDEKEENQYKFDIAYSEGKYYCLDDYDNNQNYYEEGSSVSYCISEDGYIASQVLTEGNKVETLKLTDDEGNHVKFEQPYTNPFINVDEVFYIVDEEDKSKFTLDEDGMDENYLNDICSNLTFYGNLEYKSLWFIEKDEKLSLDIETEIMEDTDSGYNFQYSFIFDVQVDSGDAFEDLKPFDQTEESKRLDDAFSKLKACSNYTITRSSQKLKEDDIGNMVNDGAPTTWNVLISEDSLYNEGSKSGYEVINGKHYQYKYNEDYRKTVSEKSVETTLGTSDPDVLKLFLQPDYSYVSGAVFNAIKADDGSVAYSIKDQLSDDAKSNIYIELLEDLENKNLASYYGLEDFSLNLDKDNNLSMSYLNSSLDFETWETTYSIETYTYSAFGSSEVPTFKELAPKQLRDIQWELEADPTSEDPLVAAGLIVKVTLDLSNNPSVVLTKGGVDVTVSDVEVSDGVISFKADSLTWHLSYSVDEKTQNQVIELTCVDTSNKSTSYNLSEVGLQAKKDAAISKIDAVDPSLYSNVLEDDDPEDEKTDKEKVEIYIKTCKEGINAATKISDINDWLETFDYYMKDMYTAIQKAAKIEVSEYRETETDNLYTVALMYTILGEDVSEEYNTTLEIALAWNDLYNQTLKDIKACNVKEDLDKIVSDYKTAVDTLLGPVSDDPTDSDVPDDSNTSDFIEKINSNLVRI